MISADAVELCPIYRDFYTHASDLNVENGAVNQANNNSDARSYVTHVSESTFSGSTSNSKVVEKVVDQQVAQPLVPEVSGPAVVRGFKRKSVSVDASNDGGPSLNSSIASVVRPPQNKKRNGE